MQSLRSFAALHPRYGATVRPAITDGIPQRGELIRSRFPWHLTGVGTPGENREDTVVCTAVDGLGGVRNT